jgi:hypothetical protein
MDKRYQVFVSSTYADLRDERQKVIQALMEMDCIPAGMELFPAADDEQWAFIKRIVDDCDYYILIIGGRYGSTTPEGVSYTEKEYDYAIKIGLKVLAFIHEKPDEIPVGKSDIDPELRRRLAAFRDKVSRGRLVKMWTSAAELPGLVALSLSKTIKTYPAVGWVRADQVANTELLSQLNDLRQRNQELEKFVSENTSNDPEQKIENLAELDEKITLSGTSYRSRPDQPWLCTLSWAELFSLIAPYLLEHPNDSLLKSKLTSSLQEKVNDSGTMAKLNDQQYQTVKIQLMALGLVDIQYAATTGGGMDLFWSLTSVGNSALMKLRSVKSNQRK